MKEVQEAVLVEKEEIPYLKFPREEILTDNEEIERRRLDLEKAMLLGNSQKRKVFIYFKDSEGFKKVHTTIWALTPKYVILKGGITLPVCRVAHVEFF